MAPTITTKHEVRPFGLTRAVPVTNLDIAPATTLCPQRQISITEAGEAFIHAPSMGSSFTSQSQTRQDSQIWTDTSTDTD